jgi:ribosomal protein S9
MGQIRAAATALARAVVELFREDLSALLRPARGSRILRGGRPFD